MWALLFGVVLPVVLFAIIDSFYGPTLGMVAGLVCGVGEIIWEWFSEGHVDSLTWGSNALLLGLGLVAVLTQKGMWLKLQPSIMEVVFAGLLGYFWFKNNDFLLSAIELHTKKLGIAFIPDGARPIFQEHYQAMTARMSFFFAFHAALSAWAAFRWSTFAWAMLKGAGLTGSFVIYGLVENMILSYTLQHR